MKLTNFFYYSRLRRRANATPIKCAKTNTQKHNNMKAKFTDVKTGETFEQSIQYASEIHALPKPNTPLCEWMEGRIITEEII